MNNNNCNCGKKSKLIGDSEIANKMIIGGVDSEYVNAFGWNNVFDVLSGGAYTATHDIQKGKFGEDTIKNILTGGWSQAGKDTGVDKNFRSSKQRQADDWNAKDPKKLFPPPQNATCRDLKALRDKLVLEQASSQYTYTQKVIAYIQEIDDVMNANNCTQKLLDEESEAQTNRSLKAANQALAATQAAAGAGNMALGASSGNSMKIGLIVGGLLFATVVTVILVRSKSSN